MADTRNQFTRHIFPPSTLRPSIFPLACRFVIFYHIRRRSCCLARSYLMTSLQVPWLSEMALLTLDRKHTGVRQDGSFSPWDPYRKLVPLVPSTLPLSHQSPFKACPEFITLLCPSQPRPRGTGPCSILLNLSDSYYDYFPKPENLDQPVVLWSFPRSNSTSRVKL